MKQISLLMLKNLNVLYVEDDSVISDQTIALQKHYFHSVFHSYTADDALTQKKKKGFLKTLELM